MAGHMNMNTTTPPVSQIRGRLAGPARTEHIETIVTLCGRALVAVLFILAGLVKIGNPKPFLEHMTQFGIPTFLLPAVIALELGAGFATLIGWRIRDAAGALAIFCVMTATIFHHQLWINAERTLFFKDLAIAGGLLVMAAGAAARTRRQRVSG
jgi:putative oxidoreductase